MNDDILKRLGASELANGRIDWGGDAMSPYSHDELVAFATMDAETGARIKAQFDDFLSVYFALPTDERDMLKVWAQREFVDPTWRNGRTFPRPEFANARFFPNAAHAGRLLDIAPAHGCHGALLYRDHYRYDLNLHTCDFSPCYNKLLTLLGVDVKHFDVRFDRLRDTYDTTFDVVTLTEVLEHVDQTAEDNIIADLHDITRLDARVLITFPVKALPHGGVPQPDDPLGHIRQPVVADVIDKMQGFNALERGRFSGGKYDQNFIILERK